MIPKIIYKRYNEIVKKTGRNKTQAKAYFEAFREIAQQKNYNYSGKNPRGYATAILYFLLDELGVRISRWEHAEDGGIAEVTLRLRLREMESNFDMAAVNSKFREKWTTK